MVFNIVGNDYRLIVAVAYRLDGGFVKFISTHAQYNKVDAEVLDMN